MSLIRALSLGLLMCASLGGVSSSRAEEFSCQPDLAFIERLRLAAGLEESLGDVYLFFSPKSARIEEGFLPLVDAVPAATVRRYHENALSRMRYQNDNQARRLQNKTYEEWSKATKRLKVDSVLKVLAEELFNNPDKVIEYALPSSEYFDNKAVHDRHYTDPKSVLKDREIQKLSQARLSSDRARYAPGGALAQEQLKHSRHQASVEEAEFEVKKRMMTEIYQHYLGLGSKPSSHPWYLEERDDDGHAALDQLCISDQFKHHKSHILPERLQYAPHIRLCLPPVDEASADD